MNKNTLKPLCILLSAGIVLMSSHTGIYATDRSKILYTNKAEEYVQSGVENAEIFMQHLSPMKMPWTGPLPHFSISYQFEDENSRYRETPLRRFETVFFISLPASALLSFLGLTAYRGAARKTGEFLPSEFIYIALSTIGISLSIAAHDNRSLYGKEIY
jgi:hypothetical protein